jgi:putative SOS response-associated peptidase YedK
MPCILDPESYDDWLSGDAKVEDVRNLLVPYPSSEMKSHPVGSDVNQARVDHPDLVTRVEASLGENLTLF